MNLLNIMKWGGEMSDFKKIRLVASGIAVLFTLGVTVTALSKENTFTEEELGLRKTSLYEENTAKPAHGEYSGKSPGESKKIERAFDNSPPMIPHETVSMSPMTIESKMTWFFTNSCPSCHKPERAKSIKATPIPKSHLIDFRTGDDLRGGLDRKRHFCVQCHVPQSDAKLPVENLFEGGFRDETGKTRSNLADTLNEGVEKN